MRLSITSDYRFCQTPDGRVWTDGAVHYRHWTSYLATFDGVNVIARVRQVAEAPANYQLADGPQVSFSPVPYYLGPWQYLRSIRSITRAVRAAVAKDDAVILTIPGQIASCLAPALRGRRYAVQVIGDPHDVFAPGVVQHPLRPLLRWWCTRRQRMQTQHADAALYVTQQSLQSRYPCSSHAVGISDVDLPPEAFVAEPRSFSGRNTWRLISVGSMAQMYKGYDVLIGALAMLVDRGLDVRLTLIGDGKFREQLESQAASLRLSERVTFLGQLPAGEAIRRELDQADLFVLPSRTEGLPRALVEAMARGLPCIASRVGGIPELLPDENLVAAGDVEALASALRSALANPAKLDEMSRRNLTTSHAYRAEALEQRRSTFFERVAARTKSATNVTLMHVTTVPVSLNFFRGQIGYLQQHGFEVQATSSPAAELDEVGKREQIAVHGVTMARRLAPLADVVSLFHLWRLLRRHRPQIVHSHTPKAGLLGTLAARLAGTPVVFLSVFGLPQMTRRGAMRWLLDQTTWLACKMAQSVWCDSRSMADYLVSQRLASRDKVIVLGHGSVNGVDTEQVFNPARIDAAARLATRAKYGIPDEAPVIGFVGRVVRDKGISELVAAWQSLRERYPALRLLIVGPLESGDAIDAADELALRNDPRVHLAGFQSDIAAHLAILDLFVNPSHREGFGIANLEASAMGLPVVATRIPGCVDSVEDGVTGTLVPPRDGKALAAAMAAYLDEPNLRTKHSAAGRARAIRDFQPLAIWQALEREYRQALAAKATSRRSASSPSGVIGNLAKRAMDVGIASVALVLLAPIMLVVVIVIAWRMGRPVLFRQTRPGRDGKPFKMYKFRTMTDAVDRDGRPLDDARRLTKLGKLLRRTSLDELPELFNVLRGDMSLVGPRPLLVQYLDRYTPEQARRHEVLPGLTGWAQVHGRNQVGWNDRLALDVWYVDHRSLWLDIQILIRTIGVVLSRRGIRAEGCETMPEFMGNDSSSPHSPCGRGAGGEGLEALT